MCYQCQRRNKQVVKYATLHFDVATYPMQFISMDLIGEFHPPTSRKHWYALTVICIKTLVCLDSDMHVNKLCLLCPFEK